MKVIKFVKDLTNLHLSKHLLFENPSELKDATVSYLLSKKEFAANTKQGFKAKLSGYPVEMNLVLSI